MTLDTAVLADLAARATPGPWHALHVAGTGEPGSFALISSAGVRDIEIDPHEHPDAAYIAAFSPDVAAALLSEIESLRKVRVAAANLSTILDNPLTPRHRSAVARAELRAALHGGTGPAQSGQGGSALSEPVPSEIPARAAVSEEGSR